LKFDILRLNDLINAGATYLDVPVRDANVITGRVLDDLPEFCREIIAYLASS
jgi:protease I